MLANHREWTDLDTLGDFGLGVHNRCGMNRHLFFSKRSRT